MSRRPRTHLPGPALTALLAALALGVTVAHAAPAGGGLSLQPAIVEHTAAPGVVGSIVLANTTASAQKITVTPRPWVATSGGVVSPDPHKDLAALVKVSKPSFTLTAGASQSVDVTLKKLPPGGSLFGAVVAVGIPVDAAKRPGITIGYRLVSRLRLDPPTDSRKLKVTVGAPRVAGANIVLPVRNIGNTIEPIGGSASVIGPPGTRNVFIADQRILPGTTAALVVGPTKGLRHGRYTLSFSLIETTTRVANGKKPLRL